VPFLVNNLNRKYVHIVLLFSPFFQFSNGKFPESLFSKLNKHQHVFSSSQTTAEFEAPYKRTNRYVELEEKKQSADLQATSLILKGHRYF
jgi:hypothetical protein